MSIFSHKITLNNHRLRSLFCIFYLLGKKNKTWNIGERSFLLPFNGSSNTWKIVWKQKCILCHYILLEDTRKDFSTIIRSWPILFYSYPHSQIILRNSNILYITSSINILVSCTLFCFDFIEVHSFDLEATNQNFVSKVVTFIFHLAVLILMEH